MMDKVPSPDGPPFPLYYHWRELIQVANEKWGGGAQWQPRALFKIYDDAQNILLRYVSYQNPSPFKKAAAFAVSFMDQGNYPIVGTSPFPNYPGVSDLSSIQNGRWPGAVLTYEYVRCYLHGATIHRDGKDATPIVLAEPIKVSKHTYVDIMQALTQISKEHAADFHLTSLLFEQLAYMENPDASYVRVL